MANPGKAPLGAFFATPGLFMFTKQQPTASGATARFEKNQIS